MRFLASDSLLYAFFSEKMKKNLKSTKISGSNFFI